jgi:hypothetical protein
MTATDERTGTRRPLPTSPGGRSRHRRRHAEAVIQAEVRRLARALAPSRVLQTEAAAGYRLEIRSRRPRLPAA